MQDEDSAPPNAGDGKLLGRALGPAADGFGKAIAPLGAEAGAATLKAGRFLISTVGDAVLGMGRAWDWLAEALGSRLKGVPEEKIVSPDARIAIPAMQALVYSMEEETIREMFANLLAASMIDDQAGSVHPAFIEIVKQMTAADAAVLQLLSKENHNELQANLGTPLRHSIVAESYTFHVNFYTDPNPAVSVENLERLGLIELRTGAHLGESHEKAESRFLAAIKSQADIVAHHILMSSDETSPRELYCTKRGINVTAMGRKFLSIAMTEKRSPQPAGSRPQDGGDEDQREPGDHDERRGA
jgi:hypothetical protein